MLISWNNHQRFPRTRRILNIQASRAYSLIEILVVVLVLVAVVGMLLPMFSQAKRNAFSATCMTNLKQMSAAHQLVMVESQTDFGLREALKYNSKSWPAYVYPRLDDEVLFCPESKFPHGTTPLNQLVLGVHEMANKDKTGTMSKARFNKIAYFMEMDDSRPWARKLGWEQFEEYVAFMEDEVGLSFEDARNSYGSIRSQTAIKYWKEKYTGYEPGKDPNHFVLMMEDFRILDHPNKESYHNFADFFVFVEPDPENEYRVKVSAQHGFQGSQDAGFLAWADTKKTVYSPATALKVGDSRSIILDKDLGSYGANPNRIFSKSALDNRILFLDYRAIVAEPDNWDEWDDAATGKPEFARHAGDTMNVAFVDGSVQMTTEDVIDLSLFSNEKVYW